MKTIHLTDKESEMQVAQIWDLLLTFHTQRRYYLQKLNQSKYYQHTIVDQMKRAALNRIKSQIRNMRLLSLKGALMIASDLQPEIDLLLNDVTPGESTKMKAFLSNCISRLAKIYFIEKHPAPCEINKVIYYPLNYGLTRTLPSHQSNNIQL